MKKDIFDSIGEECGVVGVYSFNSENVVPLLNRALIALQHRGQDSAGIAIYNNGKIDVCKKLGMVADIFDKDTIEKYQGTLGIGHVRYPTIGAGGVEDAQPFITSDSKLKIALAHNGNIANYGTLRSKLEANKSCLNSTCDAEIILEEFRLALSESNQDSFLAISRIFKELDGSYSVCAINDKGELIIFRDPHAIRPLCWGQNDDFIMFASESVALDINSIELKGDVKPGEVIIISKKGIIKKQMLEHPRKKHCVFEYVYFSRPDSVEEGKLVYDVRVELGKRLARANPVDADIVVAVPDTSRPAAVGYSQESKIPMVEGLMKNRYIGRTFIMPNQSKRLEAVKLKLNAVSKLIRGKKIVLIDDSIVRGTTSGPIVKLCKDAGAKEVHLRIACPPVMAPCFYGVDLPTYNELIAANKSVDEICKLSGADSLAYLSINDLVQSIDKPKEDLCFGCLDAKNYATEYGLKIATLMKEKGFKDGVRIWEEKNI